MRVLVIHTEYKFKGGEDSVVTEEMKLLQQHNITVDILLFSNDGNTLLKFLQLPFNISAYFKTRRKLKAYKPDVVHIHNLHFAASISVLYAIKRSKIPCVFTLHNYRLLCPSATLFYKGKNFYESLKSNFPWRAVSKGVYNNSMLLTFWLCVSIWINRSLNIWRLIDRFIVLTEHTKEIIQASILQIDSGRIVTKPNFTSDVQQENVVKDSNFLFVGRLSEEKGVEVLLEAFTNSPYNLTIVGDGPLKNKVQEFCRQNPNVTFRGFLDKPEIHNELRKCSALVFPSVWFETFGLTIIEAFATSTPVVASNIGAPSQIVEDGYNGLFFQSGSVADLKKKLQMWQTMENAKKIEYGHHARLTYERYYTPDKNFNQLVSIYSSVINEKAAVAKASAQMQPAEL